ncbi:MAG TPA: hypothetical protein VFK40_00975 [Nitrososphaeraceae archaeon]|nr:hypothetical protein [Nitrososphaeraceae archaeon]
MINIVYAEEMDRPSYEEAVDHIFRLTKQLDNIKNLGVDASNPELIISLKKKLGDLIGITLGKKSNYIKKNLDITQSMIVCPIVFNTEPLILCQVIQKDYQTIVGD